MEENKKSNFVQSFFKAAKFVFAGGLLFWLIYSGRLDFSFVLAEPLSIYHLLGLVALLANMLFQAWRWWYLLKAQKINLSLGEAIKLSWIGQFFSLILFGGAGGELVRGYYITRASSEAKVSGISTIIFDRLMGMYALVWFGIPPLLFLLIFHPGEVTPTVLQIGAFIAVLVVGLTSFFLVLRLHSTRELVLRLIPKRFLPPVKATLDAYETGGKNLLIGFAISILANIMLIAGFMLSSHVAGSPIDWTLALLIVPLVTIANSLPITPGGIGVAETAASMLFAQFGVETGATIMLIIRCWIILLRLPGLVMYALMTRPEDKLETDKGNG